MWEKERKQDSTSLKYEIVEGNIQALKFIKPQAQGSSSST